MIVIPVIGLLLFLRFVRRLNGGTLRHVDTPRSWGEGGNGDDFYRR